MLRFLIGLPGRVTGVVQVRRHVGASSVSASLQLADMLTPVVGRPLAPGGQPFASALANLHVVSQTSHKRILLSAGEEEWAAELKAPYLFSSEFFAGAGRELKRGRSLVEKACGASSSQRGEPSGAAYFTRNADKRASLQTQPPSPTPKKSKTGSYGHGQHAHSQVSGVEGTVDSAHELEHKACSVVAGDPANEYRGTALTMFSKFVVTGSDANPYAIATVKTINDMATRRMQRSAAPYNVVIQRFESAEELAHVDGVSGMPRRSIDDCIIDKVQRMRVAAPLPLPSGPPSVPPPSMPPPYKPTSVVKVVCPSNGFRGRQEMDMATRYMGFYGVIVRKEMTANGQVMYLVGFVGDEDDNLVLDVMPTLENATERETFRSELLQQVCSRASPFTLEHVGGCESQGCSL